MVRSLEGKHPNYYEAILQLRLVNPDVVDFAENQFVNGKIPVIKKVNVKNGFDYYVADSAYTRRVGKLLRQKFGGELKESSSLHTKVKGKDVYRVTVLFRMPSFRKGDIVMYGGEEYRVKAMAKEIWLVSVKDGSKARLRYTDMKLIKKKIDY